MKRKFAIQMPADVFWNRFCRRIYIIPFLAYFWGLFRPHNISPGQICGLRQGNRCVIYIDLGYRSLKMWTYEELHGRVGENGDISFCFRKSRGATFVFCFGAFLCAAFCVIFGFSWESGVALGLMIALAFVYFIPSQKCRRILRDVVYRLANEKDEEKYIY